MAVTCSRVQNRPETRLGLALVLTLILIFFFSLSLSLRLAGLCPACLGGLPAWASEGAGTVSDVLVGMGRSSSRLVGGGSTGWESCRGLLGGVGRHGSDGWVGRLGWEGSDGSEADDLEGWMVRGKGLVVRGSVLREGEIRLPRGIFVEACGWDGKHSGTMGWFGDLGHAFLINSKTFRS